MEKKTEERNFLSPPDQTGKVHNTIRLVDPEGQQLHDPVLPEKGQLQLVITDLEQQHYQLTEQAKIDLSGDLKKITQLVFVPIIKTIKQTATVRLIVHYQYATGQLAAPSQSLNLPFQRLGRHNLTIDKLTQAVQWSAWTYAGQGDLPTIQSPRLVKPLPGYNAEPSQAKMTLSAMDLASLQLQLVSGERVNFVKRVVYLAKNATATITYLDDDAEESVLAIDRVWGLFGQKITFPVSPDKRIKEFARDHLQLSSNNFQAGTTFLPAGNDFFVHLKHEKVPLNRQTSTVVERIVYHYSDGTETGIQPVVQQMLFKRDGWQDLVTGNALWQEWQRTGDLPAVASPQLEPPKVGFSSLPKPQLVTISEQDWQRIGNEPQPGQQQVITKEVIYPALPAKETTATITFYDDQKQPPVI